MTAGTSSFTPPRLAPLRWLVSPGAATPPALHGALLAALFGSLPVYFAALVNSVVTAGVVAWHHRDVHFDAWFVAETAICLARLAVLMLALRRAAAGRRTPTDLYIVLTVLWAGSLGYGGYIVIDHGDWRSVAVVCLSVAAMAGGACLRNYAAPRFAIGQILLILGPCTIAAMLSDEPLLLVVVVQFPIFLLSMAAGAFRLNRMLVRTMEAERDSQHRAHHDPLTGLCNRAGLERAYPARLDQALFYIDLDGFKRVNDDHGHMVGDTLLQQAALRLRTTIGPDALPARIGGDEFAVLARVATPADALALGEAMAQALGAPYGLGDLTISSGASIGIALPGEDGSLPAMMARADRSLYGVKALGGGARLAEAEAVPVRSVVPA